MGKRGRKKKNGRIKGQNKMTLLYVTFFAFFLIFKLNIYLMVVTFLRPTELN